MKPLPRSLPLVLLTLLLAISATISAQKQKKNEPPPGPLLTRTTTRHETRQIGYGGSIALVGAPSGAVTVETWSRNELELTADIEIHAPSEEDLARLAAIDNFTIERESLDQLRIVTTGTHDRKFIKKLGKGFPKGLVGLPWKIDYHLKVPAYVDLNIASGEGPITVTNLEGALQVSASHSDVSLTLSGGDVSVTVTTGSVKLLAKAPSWRGHGVDIHLAQGTIAVEFPAGFNGEINADVLRSGKVNATFPGLTSTDPDANAVTERTVRARAGSGGAAFAFTVGDGNIEMKQSGP